LVNAEYRVGGLELTAGMTGPLAELNEYGILFVCEWMGFTTCHVFGSLLLL